MQKSENEIRERMADKLIRHFGCDIKEATKRQIYTALSLVVRDMLASKRAAFEKEINSKGTKQVYYMSMEFLVGTSLRNNIYNLNIEEAAEDIISSLGYDISEIYNMEPDAGLGNGGLGRLAACYMDSMTTLGVPAKGFSIRYEFGIFRQKIVDGWQMEFPDNWLDMGDVWLIPRTDESVEVKFDGYVDEKWENGGMRAEHKNYNSVIAVPYEMMISGYETPAVNELVLWSAKSPNFLDMSLFSRGEYLKSVEQNAMAEAISKVLYPADDHYEGKKLRLQQQYLLVSASVQTIIKDFIKKYSDITLLPEKVAIHINDTHPSLCVPELMRILLDEYSLDWDSAWDLTSRTCAYTNHTVMSEALEKWPEALFREKLPRIYGIVREIDRRFNELLNNYYAGDTAKLEYMAIISQGQVKMANLCLACCHKVNGVSKLHSDILKNDIFHDFYYIMPQKFTNVTNGIAYRRWLCQANPRLTEYLKELIGDGFTRDATELSKLLDYKNDKEVLDSLANIKLENKKRLASYISEKNGILVDPDSIFDVQVKRLHEYKRQLLNIMHIIYLYNKIKSNPGINVQPRTFIFGAKASAGYMLAKQIIHLICKVADMVNSDTVVRDKIKVVFIEDYKVSLAEIIIPAANISEQISMAGKEASGTGNMKLMINGAVTLGTLDGANVEIREQVGDENIFIFGLTAPEVEELWRQGYNPMEYYNRSSNIREVISVMRGGIGGTDFSDVINSLVGYGYSDIYMTLADFESYREAQEKVSDAFGDSYRFGRMSLVNIAKAGVFSSDRSIKEYSKNIWNTEGINGIYK